MPYLKKTREHNIDIMYLLDFNIEGQNAMSRQIIKESLENNEDISYMEIY